MRHFKLFFFILFIPQIIFANNQLTAAVQLSQLLNQFTTFQAQFSQKTFGAHHRVMQRSEGVVMIMKPNHFRWETTNPTHQIVITNGKQLWFYDADLKQVTKQPIKKDAMSPEKLLSGDINALLHNFIVTMSIHQNQVWFHLVPKKNNQQFRSISIEFMRDQLRGMEIKNSLNQTTLFHFSNVKLNRRLSASHFQFKTKKGVDVLE